jgi:xylan 1,4-beta-xylosidase
VGGPATAAAAWTSAFLKFTSENHVPVDFVSTHAYADDTVENLLGTNEDIPMDERICRAMGKVKDEIRLSAAPNLPLFLTEWNVQGTMDARDTIFVGPALANTVGQCDGLVNLMSFWTFSDVFEEEGPIPKPFIDGYGLRAKGGINKPSFYAFGLLHELGDQRLASASKDVIVTKDGSGVMKIAAWNLVDPGQKEINKTIKFVFSNLPSDARVSIQKLDGDQGNVLQPYAAMGQPLDPTPDQVEQLNRTTALPAGVETRLKEGSLEVKLTPNSLVLVKVEP